MLLLSTKHIPTLSKKNFIDFMGVKNEMYDLSEMIRMGRPGAERRIASICISTH